MLLNFRVSNFRSFKDEASLTTLATRLDKGVGLPVQIAADGSTVDVLPVVAVLGANASGKSNLLRAMATMRDLVLNSAARPAFRDLDVDPFLLDPRCAKEPTMMEIDFSLDGDRYQYGFQTSQGKVAEEWLHTFPHKRTQVLFDREGRSGFQFGKNLGSGRNRMIADITRPEALFLSAAAGTGHPLLSRVYEFFFENLCLLDVPNRGTADIGLFRRLGERGLDTVPLLAMADLGIVDVHLRADEPASEEIAQLRREINGQQMSAVQREIVLEMLARETTSIELLHASGTRILPLSFEEESLGTKSWFSFVMNATEALDTGSVLLVDELDASLHPLLVAEALRLFQSPKTNRRGAQLIFSTHDATLLGGSAAQLERYRLSRGQVWLTEKGPDGGSTLTPLSEYRPRKGEDLERGYLQGRYGGTPLLIPSTLALNSGKHADG